MRISAAFAAGMAFLTAPAMGQELNPIADARLRYEHVDQAGLPEDADGLTFRLRVGAEAKWKRWSLLAEGEGTVALSEAYDSGLNGKTSHPLVADPENIELNRLQLQYRWPKALLTFGRQRINIEDQRFVGNSGWRQNEQTFDAIRVEYGESKGLKADLIYSWSVRTIWGIVGRNARQQAIGGNNAFATISHPTPVGTLSGFAFLVDQDEGAVQGFRLSSQTYGVRLAGDRSLSPRAKLAYVLSYARQADWHRNPSNYDADYWLADISLDIAAARLGIGQERLGADEGLAFTSFQTPLATLHKFQGWTDKFLTTPPNGVRDCYASANYGWKKVAGLDAINASLAAHRFESDRFRIHYGNEWDAMLSAKKGRWTATAKLASYDADQFATDARKFWLQLEWAS
jgi:hypothetical protein